MAFDWADFGVDLHLDVPAGGRRAGLERALRAAIRSGRLAPGSRLPATRTLALELGVARNTVAAAYDQLVAEGYLTARTGSGTTVAALPSPSPAAPLLAPLERPRFDLRPGSPDVSFFPAAAWLRAARRSLAGAPAATWDYGDPRGHPVLRAALADYLGRVRGVLAHPDRIVVTSGYVQALALLAGLHRSVAMEDPGLAFHRAVVRRAGARVVPLAVDGLGACTSALDSTVDAVVLTPANQFPLGAALAPARRRAVVDWGGLVIEDDYDGEFRYDRQPVGAVQGMAPEQVAYVGTAAKTLGPALRLGWVVLPERLVEPVVEAKRHTDYHTEVIGQLTLATLLTSHEYDRHVRAARSRYRSRRDLLLARLRGMPVRGVAAGLHALLPLPPGVREADVLAEATRRGLALGDLGSHWHAAGDHPQGLIIGYGTPSSSRYPAALDVLARLLTSVA
ncbi:GntR family transcriptional regulator / MocR family aminotransferase [Asanoa hainanensis]|uniref:GntR family transcriptional regulator / MocR family aminotransferase n=1 Tax=Asanoa hainanensis TaxID=560556 RepID=A0A239LAW5_9ACTN|nr:PLP-dependent aminotransferase family protein [Asanoa hainanensis]SNT27621.1 GntR family transcriptional regulator / MocR family aminotransferase [Asanoa hainanensis]